MGFFRQEYWSGLPCPPPGDLPDPGIEPRSPTRQADSLPFKPPGEPLSHPAISILYNKNHSLTLTYFPWLVYHIGLV